MMQEKKPVIIAGRLQNCYRIDGRTKPVGVPSSIASHTIKQYNSLERVAERNGYRDEIQRKDYPINSESVTSYADGADYRRDPAQAIANAPKRVNLGDISEAQDFLRENPQEAALRYKSILDKVEAYFAAKEKEKQNPPQNPPQGGNE